MKERGFSDESDIEMFKNLRRDTDETSDRMEEIITIIEGIYIGKGKKTKELKNIEDYLNMIKD